MPLPNFGRDQGEEVGVFLLEPGLEQAQAAQAQRLDRQEEVFARRDPLAPVGGEPPRREPDSGYGGER